MKTQLCFKSFLIPFYMILFGINTILVSGQCQTNHQSILIQFKNELQFNYSLSTKLVTWNLNATGCCSWGGVTCNVKGQVIGLDLSNETILGGMIDSSALFGLKHLESLNFAENNFSFTKIPTRFGSLTSLLYLNLSNSMFSGQIPGELSQLTRLEILDLSEPLSFGISSLRLEKPNLSTLVQNLTQLKGLYLDNVNISAQKLDWCQGLSSSLRNLEVLSLSDCQLSGPLDDSLGNLQSLSVIRLASNNLSAPIPDFFATFKNLTVMNLANCNLNGKFPKQVLQLQSLQNVDLALNKKLSGSLPDFHINGSLRSLVLGNTNFSGVIPESIGNLENLSRIELYQSDFSGRIPRSMEKLTQLSYIDLSSNRLTGQIPSFQLCKSLEFIDLSSNSLSSMIPSPYFQDLQSLILVDLSDNSFDGLLPQFSNSSSPLLEWLDFSSNKLDGQIPRSYFELGQLSVLILSSNNLSGVIETTDFQGLSNLTTLDLSFNRFSIIASSNSSSVSYLPKLISLNLASCNLHKFPNLQNHSALMNVDLSDNKIQGEIPNWIWEVGNGGLFYINLSHNRLTALEEPYTFPFKLAFLDIHSNNLSGVIRAPPITATYIDYSNNLLNLSLSEISWRDFNYLFFFSASNNLLTGAIPKTICKATYLRVVDLSNNHLTGRIPQCLIEFGNDLGVLNLANNGLTGQIEGTFPTNCSLNALDLHGNSLAGEIPRSLVNCTILDVLNLGNNKINDTYPCFLGTITNLHVLVLRSNRLHGSVHCGRRQYNWSHLQILDIARNDFNGVLPPEFFSQWGAMMTAENRNISKKQLRFRVSQYSEWYYQDSVTVTVKGFELDLVKILAIFTTLDISSNRFSGVIPETIGRLKALYLLNVSHNEFRGSIPLSTGHLSQLESLDMSSNKITGEIPSVLTSLSFLSALNLSYNQLEGKIPTGSQFQTFTETSYLGNKRLCGFPLKRTCNSSVLPVPPSSPNSGASSDGNDWQTIFYGMGAGAGSLTVAAVLYTLYKAHTSSTTRQTRSV